MKEGSVQVLLSLQKQDARDILAVSSLTIVTIQLISMAPIHSIGHDDERRFCAGAPKPAEATYSEHSNCVYTR